MENVVSLLSTQPFAIVICLICFYYIYKNNKQQIEDTKAREDKYFNQISDFNSSLNNFNNTLISLDKRLESVEDILKDQK